LRLSQFDFFLSDELIARYPLPERSASRLLCLDKATKQLSHRTFKDLLNLLSPHDLLIFNNTKVIPARLFGIKASGGHIEVLIERVLSEYQVLAHIRASKSPKAGSTIILESAITCQVLGRRGELFELQCLHEQPILALLEQYGHIPLPSYMERADEAADKTRYQTVYAKEMGAVAAPTAGLHFDEPLLNAIKAKGVETAFVTLHVGAGTFQPVRSEIITEHQMHAEYLEVSEQVCAQVKAAKLRGGRVIAVGTTSVRALETAAQDGEIKPYTGDSRLFIYPGYKFHCVDAMITNFHLPKSSLLMLVCAFGGYEFLLASYQAAIHEKYRFYSYGDAMWIG